MYQFQYDQHRAAKLQEATEEMIRMREPVAPRVKVETADGFLVISCSRPPKSVIPPYLYDYYYDHFERESDATEFYGEIERGDYSDTREVVALVACRRGVPLGSKRIV